MWCWWLAGGVTRWALTAPATPSPSVKYIIISSISEKVYILLNPDSWDKNATFQLPFAVVLICTKCCEAGYQFLADCVRIQVLRCNFRSILKKAGLRMWIRMDPHYWIRIRIGVKIWIRIRIKDKIEKL
jgi:hypothetical protein